MSFFDFLSLICFRIWTFGDPKRCFCGTPDAELLDLELAVPLADLALADELLEAAAPLLEARACS